MPNAISDIFHRSLWIDEGYSNLTSLLIAKNWSPLYPSGYWDGSYFIFHALQAGAFNLFGYSDAVSRIVPFCFGILSLFLVYAIGKEAFNKRSALLATATTALSYSYLIAIVQARYYAPMIFLYLLGILAVTVFAQKKTMASFHFAFAVTLFAILFHVYLYSLVAPLAIAAGWICWENRSQLRVGWKATMLQAAIAAGLLSLFLICLQRLNPWVSPESISDTMRYVKFDYTSRYADFFASEYWILFLLAHLSVLLLSIREKRLLRTVLIVSFLFPYFVIGNYVFMFATRYVYFLIPVCVLLGTGFAEHMAARIRRPVARWCASAVLAVLFVSTISFWPFHSGEWSMHDRYAPEPDFKSAYDFVREDSAGRAFSVFSPFPHMDLLYLGRSDGYFYMDESGMNRPPAENFYVSNWRHIFTNSVSIVDPPGLRGLETGSNYVVLDQVGLARLRNSSLLEYVTGNYSKVFEKSSGYNRIEVFKKTRISTSTAKQRAKLSRFLGWSASKSCHPGLCNLPAFLPGNLGCYPWKS